MKTITIPTQYGNPIKVIINTGRELFFEAGKTYTVSDEVAELINALGSGVAPENSPEIEIVTVISSKSNNKELPTAKAVYDELVRIENKIPGAATTTAAGTVKKASKLTVPLPGLSDQVMGANFIELVQSLIAAGILESGS